MKSTLMLFAILLHFFTFCQDGENSQKKKPNYNRWSIDAGVGLNNPVKNFTPGYNTSLFSIGKVEIGPRFMFNPYFGLRLDATFNRFQDSHDSPDFATNHGRVELDGIIDIGNTLRFYDWTKRISLLGHIGVGLGRLQPDGFPLNIIPTAKSNSDRTGSVSMGLTPQIKLTEKIAINLDASVVFLAKNHKTFDHNSDAQTGGFNSQFFEGSIGLSYYLGKKETHADWTPTKTVSKEELDALAAENEKLRKGLLDDDKDGVPNYLDQELETPLNYPVDNKGVTDLTKLDTDQDGIPDSYDDCPEEKGPFSTNGCPDSDKDGVPDKADKCPNEPGNMADQGCKPVVKSAINGSSAGYPIVYFKTSSSALSSEMKSKLDGAVQKLKANPSQSISLNGHADSSGPESYNQNLSVDRANETKKYLTQKGINASRINTSGYSSSQPAATNDSSGGRAQNRRVEIQLK